MKRPFSLIPAALAVLLCNAVAQAGSIQRTNASLLTAQVRSKDAILQLFPSSKSAGANNSPPADSPESLGSLVHFTSGTRLLSSDVDEPDLLSFSLPVSSSALAIQNTNLAISTVAVIYLNGTADDFAYDISDVGFRSFFVCLQASNVDAFQRDRNANDDEELVIGPLTISTAAIASIPEPASDRLWVAGAILLSIARVRSRFRVKAELQNCDC